VVRTRVGYAGGTTADPTYRRIGDHTETLQVEFDPAVISYEQLLEVFWNDHNPCGAPWSAQYMSAVFCHDDVQLAAAQKSASAVAAARGAPVKTRIERAGRFYRAEDYHQKYTLRRHQPIARELLALYPDPDAFTDSTATARLNGYLAGHGAPSGLPRSKATKPAETDPIEDLPRLGLTPAGQAALKSSCGLR
jgi:peptide-methionine (S)-S-oxide reductase